MKKIMIFLFIVITFTSMAADQSDLQCRTFFNEIKKPKIEQQKKMYVMAENCRKYLGTDKELLALMVKAYNELFKVNPSHFHLEPLMPFYMKNKKMVDELVEKMSSKKEKEEFDERLRTAAREYSEGNGN